jgi:hypothetical protein
MGHKASGDLWSPYIDTPDHYGFFKFNNATLHTLSDRDFEAIVDNDERWAALRERMEADFGDALDMFPFDRDDDTQGHDRNWIENAGRTLGNGLKGAARGLGLSRIDLPKRYHAISQALIEKRFPGGRAAGDPGDGDLRDMIGDFRILFKRNFANYILRKRFYQVVSSLAFAGFVAATLVWHGAITDASRHWLGYGCQALKTTCDPLSTTIVTDAVFAGLFVLAYAMVSFTYRLFSDHAFHAYKNAQTESCKTLDKQAALRTKNLSNLISTLLPRIDKDQAELIARGRIKDWPDRSRKWVLCLQDHGRGDQSPDPGAGACGSRRPAGPGGVAEGRRSGRPGSGGRHRRSFVRCPMAADRGALEYRPRPDRGQYRRRQLGPLRAGAPARTPGRPGLSRQAVPVAARGLGCRQEPLKRTVVSI